jgi:hypothetical protein
LGHLEALTLRWTRSSGCNFLYRTVFEFAQSIGDTFGAITGGQFENFPCEDEHFLQFFYVWQNKKLTIKSRDKSEDVGVMGQE